MHTYICVNTYTVKLDVEKMLKWKLDVLQKIVFPCYDEKYSVSLKSIWQKYLALRF